MSLTSLRACGRVTREAMPVQVPGGVALLLCDLLLDTAHCQILSQDKVRPRTGDKSEGLKKKGFVNSIMHKYA